MSPPRRLAGFPRRRWALCLLVVTFLGVGTVYNVTTPLFEAPDEQWHFAFVQHLATGGGLPVFGQDQQAAYRQEGFQPPLYALGSGIALESAQAPTQVRAGGSFTVTLGRRSVATVDRDYTVFVHAVSPTGVTVAQADGEPQQGALPTSFWERGELVPDTAVVNVPAGLPAGEYRLILGMYELATGQRLPVKDASGQPSGDSILLGSIVIN